LRGAVVIPFLSFVRSFVRSLLLLLLLLLSAVSVRSRSLARVRPLRLLQGKNGLLLLDGARTAARRPTTDPAAAAGS
jgi:hypothetical protein